MLIKNLFLKAAGKLRQPEIFFVLLFFIFYTLAASSVSLNRYWQYDAFWYDFGIFDETIFKLSRFQLPVIPTLSPSDGKIVWGDHLNPSAAVLAPLYWFTDKQEVILLSQVFFVVASAGVAYLVARKTIHNSLIRIALVVSYLGFVGMQNALYTDVHNIVFALLPLMLTIWAVFNNKWRLYWVFLLLTMGFQENLAAVCMGLGFFLMLRKEKHIKTGIITIVVSLLYALIATRIIIPYFNHGAYTYRPDMPLVWHEWFSRFFSRDLKGPTVLFTFLTFGLLPIGSLATFPLIIEHFLERFVLNTAATRWDLGFHYNAILSPIMFLGAVDFLQKIQARPKFKKFLSVWAIGMLGLVFFLHRFYLHGPLMLATHPVFYEQTKRNEFITAFVRQIPTNGLLMVQNNLAAHFTHNRIVLLNENIDLVRPDIIAIDVRPGQNANNYFPMSQSRVAAFVASVSAHPDYEKTAVTDSQFIFLKK